MNRGLSFDYLGALAIEYAYAYFIAKQFMGPMRVRSRSRLSMNRAMAIPRHLYVEVRTADCGVWSVEFAICYLTSAIGYRLRLVHGNSARV